MILMLHIEGSIVLSLKPKSVHIPSVSFCEGVLYIIKSGCEWRSDKKLLSICIFEGTLFSLYNFLIYFKSSCQQERKKLMTKCNKCVT
ncbi:hypothetical protein HanPSC8_Chr04g0139121 [Helianthus annuus]|nr:hypothetical protein HanPSC8_Chr04g0139121 [Helianthus annuus]